MDRSLDISSLQQNKPYLHLHSYFNCYGDSRDFNASANIVKKDILTLLEHIHDKHSHYFDKNVQLLRGVQMQSQNNQEQLFTILERVHATCLILKNQKLRRFNARNGESGDGSNGGSMYDEGLLLDKTPNNVTALLTVPEHFNGKAHSNFHKRVPTNNSKSSRVASRTTATAGAKANRATEINPWEGTDYKYSLVLSLYGKLLKKLVFESLVYAVQLRRNNQQIALSCVRRRIRHLQQECFNSLLFAALSNKYIDLSSTRKCDRYVGGKFLKPVLSCLSRLVHNKRQVQRTHKVVQQEYRQRLLMRGFSTLLRNKMYNSLHHVYKVWSTRTARRLRQHKALFSWIYIFTKRQELRSQILTRFGNQTKNIGVSSPMQGSSGGGGEGGGMMFSPTGLFRGAHYNEEEMYRVRSPQKQPVGEDDDSPVRASSLQFLRLQHLLVLEQLGRLRLELIQSRSEMASRHQRSLALLPAILARAVCCSYAGTTEGANIFLGSGSGTGTGGHSSGALKDSDIINDNSSNNNNTANGNYSNHYREGASTLTNHSNKDYKSSIPRRGAVPSSSEARLALCVCEVLLCSQHPILMQQYNKQREWRQRGNRASFGNNIQLEGETDGFALSSTNTAPTNAASIATKDRGGGSRSVPLMPSGVTAADSVFGAYGRSELRGGQGRLTRAQHLAAGSLLGIEKGDLIRDHIEGVSSIGDGSSSSISNNRNSNSNYSRDRAVILDTSADSIKQRVFASTTVVADLQDAIEENIKSIRATLTAANRSRTLLPQRHLGGEGTGTKRESSKRHPSSSSSSSPLRSTNGRRSTAAASSSSSSSVPLRHHNNNNNNNSPSHAGTDPLHHYRNNNMSKSNAYNDDDDDDDDDGGGGEGASSASSSSFAVRAAAAERDRTAIDEDEDDYYDDDGPHQVKDGGGHGATLTGLFDRAAAAACSLAESGASPTKGKHPYQARRNISNYGDDDGGDDDDDDKGYGHSDDGEYEEEDDETTYARLVASQQQQQQQQQNGPHRFEYGTDGTGRDDIKNINGTYSLSSPPGRTATATGAAASASASAGDTDTAYIHQMDSPSSTISFTLPSMMAGSAGPTGGGIPYPSSTPSPSALNGSVALPLNQQLLQNSANSWQRHRRSSIKTKRTQEQEKTEEEDEEEHPSSFGFCAAIEDDSDVEENCARTILTQQQRAGRSSSSSSSSSSKLNMALRRGGGLEFFSSGEQLHRLRLQHQEELREEEEAVGPAAAEDEMARYKQMVYYASRQYRERTADQFRMIKFNWMIAQCRRFVRRLLYLRRVARNRGTLRLKTRHDGKKRTLAAWYHAYLMRLRQSELCGKVYILKYMKKLMSEWYVHTVKFRRVSKMRLKHIAKRVVLLGIWASWRQARRNTWLQQDAEHKMRLLRKEQVMEVWKGVVRQARRISLIHLRYCRVKTLGPLFGAWKEKFDKRRLLSRVFTIHRDAWAWRKFGGPTDFSLLLRIFTAWSQRAKQRKRAVRSQHFESTALYFRAATLMARFFVLWNEVVTVAKRQRTSARKHTERLAQRCFYLWRSETEHVGMVVRSARRASAQRLMHQLYRTWKWQTYGSLFLRPRRHHKGYLLRAAFDELKVQRAKRLLESDLLPMLSHRNMKKRFSAWHTLMNRRQRLRRGFQRLHGVFNRFRTRLAIHAWPGREEWVKSEEMRSFRRRCRGTKPGVRLVDIPEPHVLTAAAQAKRESELHAEFLKQQAAARHPSLIDRSIALGYVANRLDVHASDHIHLLMRTVLNNWYNEVHKVFMLRRRGRKLLVLSENRTMLQGLRHWISLTPRTSHRMVTWIGKRYPRPHDDYIYRKQEGARAKSHEEEYENMNEQELRTRRSTVVAEFTKKIVDASHHSGITKPLR